MVIGKKMQDAINKQINAELYSSYVYLAMAADCETKGFVGFGKWMRKQSEEENAHAIKLFDFVLDRGGRAELQAIDKPKSSFGSVKQMFEQSLKHERLVTDMIHKLHALAVAQKDHASAVMLEWFIEEQVEEEKTATEILDSLKLAGTNPAALLMLDREVGARETAE
ncbi:ferritin [Candidatus Mycalebacterium sp.]